MKRKYKHDTNVQVGLKINPLNISLPKQDPRLPVGIRAKLVEAEKPLISPVRPRKPSGKLTTNYNQPKGYYRLQGGHTIINESVNTQTCKLETAEKDVKTISEVSSKRKFAESSLDTFTERTIITNYASATALVKALNFPHRRDAGNIESIRLTYLQDLENLFNLCGQCYKPIKVKYANPIIARHRFNPIDLTSDAGKAIVEQSNNLFELHKRQLLEKFVNGFEAKFNRRKIRSITNFANDGKRTKSLERIVPLLDKPRLPNSLFYADIQPFYRVIQNNAGKFEAVLIDGTGEHKYYRNLHYWIKNDAGELIRIPFYNLPTSFRILGEKCDCYK